MTDCSDAPIQPEVSNPRPYLVAEWIHFTLLGIIVPTIKLKVYTFSGLMNSATKPKSPTLHSFSTCQAAEAIGIARRD